MNKDISDGCWDCNKPDQIFNSPKWAAEKTILKNRVGETLTPQNIVDKIIRYKNSWKDARKL